MFGLPEKKDSDATRHFEAAVQRSVVLQKHRDDQAKALRNGAESDQEHRQHIADAPYAKDCRGGQAEVPRVRMPIA
jgi:hypothetical protein